MQERSQLPTTPPYSGAALVADINELASTLGTDFAGFVDPAAIAWPYSMWADTGSGVLKRRSAANTAWLVERPLFFDTTIRRARLTVNGTFVVPLGVTTIFVSACGGGGGGGGAAGYSASAYFQGGGGGAGENVVAVPYTVTPGSTLAVTVGGPGAGGAGGSDGNAGSPGGAGGNTTISTVVTLAGGSGGLGGSASGESVGGAGWPNGGGGPWVPRATDTRPTSAAGASSPFGGGGPAAVSTNPGTQGVSAGGFGAGGGGGCSPVASGWAANERNGGAGSPGIVIIEW